MTNEAPSAHLHQTGMLATSDVITTVVSALKSHSAATVVVDPVMVAANGQGLPHITIAIAIAIANYAAPLPLFHLGIVTPQPSFAQPRITLTRQTIYFASPQQRIHRLQRVVRSNRVLHQWPTACTLQASIPPWVQHDPNHHSHQVLESLGVGHSAPHPEATLLEYLRGVADLQGTKLGCGTGSCGACTVMLSRVENGQIRHRSVNACIYPVCLLDGAHVTTIEGIGSLKNMHPVQVARL